MWFLKTLEKKPDQAIQDTIDSVVKVAKDKWSMSYEGEYPTSGIGLGSLRPYHVQNTTTNLPNHGYNVWHINIAAQRTWQDWVNTIVNDDLYVIVAGIFNWTPSPSATEISFSANGVDLPAENFEQIYANDTAQGWFSKPFSVSPRNNVTVRLYGNTPQVELMGLLGFAIAKRTLLITDN